MARRPAGPWYRRNRGWYATMSESGKQQFLGVRDPNNEAEAFEAFKRLMAAMGDRPKAGTVAEAVPRFRAAREQAGASEATLAWYKKYHGWLTDRFGAVPVDQLDPNAVAGAAHGMPKWGPDTVRNALMACESLLRFCGRQVTIQKPPRGSAGAKAVIPEDVYRRAVEMATGDLGPLLIVLWNTGARPGEIRQLTAEQVDWSAGVATLTRHKTARKTGKPRLIVFPPAAMEVLARQRERHGAGYLFRHCRGEPFSSVHLTVRVWGLSKKVGVRFFAYGFRHAFATDALAAGVPDVHVASLLGHANTTMLHKNYSHLTARTGLLKDAAARVRPA